MAAALRLRPRTVDLLWLAGLTFATFLIYGSSLSYPFFWVDPIDIGLAGSRSIPTILTNSQGYLYYRPFAFILWKALHALSGRFDPFAFHLAQVLTHVLNVWLLYALARRLFGRRALAGITALCFAWYPASYQTVTWVVSPHVQAMPFLLGSAIVYYDARRPLRFASGAFGKPGFSGRMWLSLLLLALALPFQENAISFGFVIAALEIYLALNKPNGQPAAPLTERLSENPGPLTTKAQRHQEFKGFSSSLRVFVVNFQTGTDHFSRWPLAHIGVCFAFAVLWFVIPKDPDSAVARFEPAAGWYLLQGLIWPVAGAVGPWRAWLDGPAWQPLILAAPPALLFLLAAYLHARRLSLLMLGLAWFAAMMLPIWATRGIDYVSISPRIFYIGAPGAILIWVGLLSFHLKSPREASNRIWKIGAALLAGLTIIQSALFLSVRKSLQDGAMPAIWDVIHSGQQAGRDASLLYVNVPDQITPRLREYPIGFFRAVLMPVSVDLGQYVELQTGVRPAPRSLSVPALAGLKNFPHQVDMRGEAADQSELSAAIRAADAVFFTEYDPSGRVRVVEAGSVKSQISKRRYVANDYRAAFDDRARLVDVEIAPEDSRLRVMSAWGCLATFDAQDTIFVHAIDAGGQLAAQADGDPLRGLLPLSECQPGEQIRDVRFITLPPGAYAIRVGIYNRVSGERLTAVDATGQALPDGAATISQFTWPLEP